MGRRKMPQACTHSPVSNAPVFLTSVGIVTTASWELLDPFVRQVVQHHTHRKQGLKCEKIWGHKGQHN